MASAVGFHPCETSCSTVSIGVELGGVLRPHLLKGLTVIYEGNLLVGMGNMKVVSFLSIADELLISWCRMSLREEMWKESSPTRL